MKLRQKARQITTTLLLATALINFGCMKAPRGETIMGEKPKTPVVLRDAQEEVKSPKRALDVVPQKTEKVKVTKTPEGDILTYPSGMKILKKKDGGVTVLETPEPKPIIKPSIH